VAWIGNGELVSVGATVALAGLPPGLAYVRAVLVDVEGRVLYTQPFELPEPSSGAGLMGGIALIVLLGRRAQPRAGRRRARAENVRDRSR